MAEVEREYYPNGNLRWSRSCINNIFNGEYKLYYDNGELIRSSIFENGIEIKK